MKRFIGNCFKTCRNEKLFKDIKFFILNKTYFSRAETHFSQPEILKIFWGKKRTWNGFKTWRNEKLSCFERIEEIKMFRFKKKIQLKAFKDFHFQ